MLIKYLWLHFLLVLIFISFRYASQYIISQYSTNKPSEVKIFYHTSNHIFLTPTILGQLQMRKIYAENIQGLKSQQPSKILI